MRHDSECGCHKYVGILFSAFIQDCISRIQELQESGQLTGVMDDRGKFIHITTDEYEAVARFIRQRGRVSLSELAASSNVLVNMAPDNAATHKKLIGEVTC